MPLINLDTLEKMEVSQILLALKMQRQSKNTMIYATEIHQDNMLEQLTTCYELIEKLNVNMDIPAAVHELGRDYIFNNSILLSAVLTIALDLEAFSEHGNGLSSSDLKDTLNKLNAEEKYAPVIYTHLYKILSYYYAQAQTAGNLNAQDILNANLSILYEKIIEDIIALDQTKTDVAMTVYFKKLPVELQGIIAFKITTEHNNYQNFGIFGNYIQQLSEAAVTKIDLIFDKLKNEMFALDTPGLSNQEQQTKNLQINMLLDKFLIYQAQNFEDNEKYSLLMYAIFFNNIDVLRKLVLNGANINFKSGAGFYPLEWALMNLEQSKTAAEIDRNIKTIEYLLANGANILEPKILFVIQRIYTSVPQMLPVLEANEDYNNHNKLLELISTKVPITGADIHLFQNSKVINSAGASGYTPLMQSVKSGNLAAAKLLLANESLDPNVRDFDGNTALHHAASSNNYEMLSLLYYDNKKSPNTIRIHPTNKAGDTPYLLAFKNGYSTVATFFASDEAAQITRSFFELLYSNDSVSTSDLLLELDRYFNTPEKEMIKRDIFNFIDPQTNNDLLCLSIELGNYNIFAFCLQHIDLYDNKTAALDYALFKAIKHDNLSMVKSLLDAGADINGLVTGFSVLINAVASDSSLEVIELLLARGADVNYQTAEGITPLMLACIGASVELVAELLQYNADATLYNIYGETALTISVKNGYHDIVEKLTGGDLQKAHYSELMIALWNGNYASNVNSQLETDERDVWSLINDDEYISKHINDVNAGGLTALIIAAQKYNTLDGNSIRDFRQQETLFRIICELIKVGANVGIVNLLNINFISEAIKAKIFDDPSKIEAFFDLMRDANIVTHNQGKNIFHFCFPSNASLLDLILDTFPKETIKSLINNLNEDGNSPLSYLLFDTHSRYEFYLIEKLVDEYGAKFIRNGIEYFTPLQLKVLTLKNEDNIAVMKLSLNDKISIDWQNPQGLTALHYACLRENAELANLLIKKGASLDVRDNLGRTPLHYAALHDLTLNGAKLIDFRVEDNKGITPLMLAHQHDARDLLSKLPDALNSMDPTLPRLDKFLATIQLVSQDTLPIILADLQFDQQLNYHEKLVLLSAVKQAFFNHGLDLDDCNPMLNETANQVLQVEFSNSDKYNNYVFPPGFAIGIELEIPELPDTALIPISEFISWFPTSLVEDRTVHRSILSQQNREEDAREELEFVSFVIQDSTSYNMFLAMCEIFTEYGAKINSSSGMHCHVNARGSSTTTPPVASLFDQSDPNWHEKELIYLQFLLLNFTSLEQLLRGFLREGELFEEFGSSYVETVSKYRDGILASSSVEELQQKYFRHTTTLDLTALNKHGTVEFRAHEAAVEPKIVNAWVECVTRLSAISYSQAIEYINSAPTMRPAIEPKEGIEQLAYLLIAQRDYAQTWDADWGATKTANIRTASNYPGFDKTPAQVQIQQSPFYQILGIVLQYMDGKPAIQPVESLQAALQDCMQQHEQFFDPSQKETAHSTLEQVALMVKFISDNPGLIKHQIDLEPNRDQLYDACFDAIKDLAKQYGPNSLTLA